MTLEFNCPGCSRPLNDTKTHTGHLGLTPSPGDLNLCGHCACLAVFDTSPAGLHQMTPAEWLDLTPDDRKEFLFALRNIIARAKQINASYQPPPFDLQ